MVVLLEGSPISTEELWSSLRVTIRFLVTSLTKALLPQLLRLAGRTAFGGSKLLSFKNNGGHCVLGDHQCCKTFLVPFPRSMVRHNPALQTIPSTSWLGLFSALSTVGPIIDRCMPLRIMSNQFNLPQVASNQVVATSQG